MTIFLIGYMASGKTTLGRALSRATGMTFIDLDFYIQQRYRKTISEIFAEFGEERFREIEREMLHEVGEFCDVIVSCGGGTPCYFDNMDFMNQRGTTIWLQAGVECTVRRLLTAKTRRPIVEHILPAELPKFIQSHLEERRPHYSKARLSFPSEKIETRAEIAEQVDRLITLLSLQPK